MANTMWLPCNWKVVLDNFNESYHVPTVHMAATPDTNRKEIRGNINTYFKETRFDLSDEGHNRMVMEGGYGVGSTDKEGNILEPLASQLRYWELDPEDFKGKPEDTRSAIQEAKRKLGASRGYTHYDRVPDQQLTDALPLHAVSQLCGVRMVGWLSLPARPTAPQRPGAVPVRQLVVRQPGVDRGWTGTRCRGCH